MSAFGKIRRDDQVKARPCSTYILHKVLVSWDRVWVKPAHSSSLHPLRSSPYPSHKRTHLLVGIKTPFAGLLSAWVGCHRSCFSFRGSEVACSVCTPVSILHFGNSKNRFVPILPASLTFFFHSPFGSHAYIVPGLSSHCSLSRVFILFDSAAECIHSRPVTTWL